MRAMYGIAFLAILGGCNTFQDMGDRPAPRVLAAFTDPACGAVARQRVEDAVVNGYAELQDRIARDAYAGCMVHKARTNLAALTP